MFETGSIRRPLISILIMPPPLESRTPSKPQSPDQRVRQAASDAHSHVSPRLRPPARPRRGRSGCRGSGPCSVRCRSTPSTRISNSRPTRPRLILELDGLLELEEPGQSHGGHALGHLGLAPPPRRRGARPRRVAKPEEAPESNVPDEGERLLEVLVGLARKPDDEVRGDETPGRGHSDAFDDRHVLGRRVAPLHPPQDPIRARLRRQVEVGRDPSSLGEGRDEIVVHEARVRGQETHALRGPRSERRGAGARRGRIPPGDRGRR